MNIENITTTKDQIIYKIDGKDFAFDMDEEIIKFINKYKIGLYSLVSETTTYGNLIFKERYKVKGVYEKHVWINKKIPNHIYLSLDEHKIKEYIESIYSKKYPHLKFYMLDLKIPKEGYLKANFNMYGKFNNKNTIYKYDSPAVIEKLATGKRKIQQEDYYKNFNLEYFITPDNKVKKGTVETLFKFIKKIYNINS